MNGTLGIIGGMGPFASAYFYKRLVDLQKVTREQEQIDILLYSKPSIPDRTAFILGRDGALNPFDSILEAGRVLENAGVDCIAIPCVTAHFFYDDLVRHLHVPVINAADEAAHRAAVTGAKKAGLLATEGTVRGRVLHNALSKYNAEAVTLPEREQRRLMELIYNAAKIGERLDTVTLTELCENLYGLGAEVIINGCTEISLAGPEWHGGRNIDALEVLAEAALNKMGIYSANQLT